MILISTAGYFELVQNQCSSETQSIEDFPVNNKRGKARGTTDIYSASNKWRWISLS